MTGARDTAKQLDSAIDTLLQDPARPAPAGEGELVATARLLRDALPRLHPRFSFEEHLAARLAGARRVAAGDGPSPAPTPIEPRLVTAIPSSEDVPADEAAEHRRLGLVAGGAIASGVSLAGAALVVWRRSRSSGGMF